MKRQNINSYVYISDMTDNVRPSILEKIESGFRDANVWYIKDLCSMSEDGLRQFPYVTSELVNDIKCYLGGYGLKLGMTGEELVEYQDAEFLEKHPYVGISDETDDEVSIKGVWGAEFKESKFLKDVVNDTDMLHRIAEETQSDTITPKESVSEKKIFDPFKEMRRAYANTMYDPTLITPTDSEWIFHQIRLDMLKEQPWFIKWFVPFDIRIKMAFDKADIIMKQYKKNAVERSVVFREKHADGSLERMRSGD